MHTPKFLNAETQRPQRNTDISSVHLAFAFLFVLDGLCVLYVNNFGFAWSKFMARTDLLKLLQDLSAGTPVNSSI